MLSEKLFDKTKVLTNWLSICCRDLLLLQLTHAKPEIITILKISFFITLSFYTNIDKSKFFPNTKKL